MLFSCPACSLVSCVFTRVLCIFSILSVYSCYFCPGCPIQSRAIKRGLLFAGPLRPPLGGYEGQDEQNPLVAVQALV
jgi:hypothetical protein